MVILLHCRRNLLITWWIKFYDALVDLRPIGIRSIVITYKSPNISVYTIFINKFLYKFHWNVWNQRCKDGAWKNICKRSNGKAIDSWKESLEPNREWDWNWTARTKSVFRVRKLRPWIRSIRWSITGYEWTAHATTVFRENNMFEGASFGWTGSMFCNPKRGNAERFGSPPFLPVSGDLPKMKYYLDTGGWN